MSKQDKQIIGIKDLSDLNKWLEVLGYSEHIYFNSIEKYLKRYREAEGLLNNPIDWGKIAEIVEAGYTDEIVGSEMYLRLVEKHLKTQIKDGSTLWELTIDESQSPTDEEGIGYSNHLVDSANLFRYEVYLYYLLSVTKNYSDLLKIDPSEFNLPEEWVTNRKETTPLNKEQMILKTLFFKYDLDTSTGIELGRAPLREIANHCKAPYSVILEAQKVY